MKNSNGSQNSLKIELTQLPPKGFHTELTSHKPNWRATLEGMGDGRFRVHMTKKR